MPTHHLARQIAADLLSIRAVFLRPAQPFTWASGIQSPIYCDNRLTYSDPLARTHVEEGFAALVREAYPACEILMGTSTSGIGHAAITAHLLGLPMGYVRGGAKTHGRGGRIEGKLLPGQKAVVVEDLISTAGSALEVVAALREAGAEVLGILSIFTYNMKKGLDNLAAASVKNTSLTDFETLISVAVETGYIPASAEAALFAFRDNPGDTGWQKML
ncbi:MAG: orotate phosphoribosyltransferase [Oscillospiraceae bacterium]|jgi:orotate phosphoribosyltransferase|nr:orotate phosphoribosyltransferase [Oscillospiraceae bacterium]